MQRLRLEDLQEMVDVGKLSNLATHCYKCNKILYATREEARSIGSRMALKGKGRTRPYHCPKCEGWHLTAKMELPNHVRDKSSRHKSP